MRCEDCNSLLEELLDGELSEEVEQSISAHLASCASCAGLHQELLAEQEVYSSYSRDFEVSPALWMQVQERIKAESMNSVRVTEGLGFFKRLFSVPRLSFSVAAALVILTAVATVATIRVFERGKVSTNPPDASSPSGTTEETAKNEHPQKVVEDTVKPQPPTALLAVKAKAGTSVKETTPDQLVREAEQKYVTAIAILTKDVEKRRDQLDPIMLAQLDLAITQIDSAIADTKRAMRQNNNDPNALQYLLAAYSRKYEVLKEIADY